MARKSAVVLIVSIMFSVLAIFSVQAEEKTLTVKEMPVSGSIMPESRYSILNENDSYALYADMNTGDFALQDRAANYTWYSGQWDVLNKEHPANWSATGRIKTDLVSLIAVSYVQVSTIAKTAVPTVQNSYAYSVVKGNVKTEKVENGYRVYFTFLDIGATIPVEITLTKTGVKAVVLTSKMQLDNEYRVTSVDLLPGFMAADERLNGYLFVPSGSGALVSIGAGKGDISSYQEMVYGRDGAIKQEEYEGKGRQVLMPVIGMKAGDNAVTAIISKGDSSAEICAESNGSTSGYSRVYPRYTTAIIDSTSLFEADYFNKRTIYSVENRAKYDDFEVQYTFTRGEKANYAGMAEVYRNYLISSDKLSEKAKIPSLNIALYGAATKKASFLGIPYNKTFALTTYSEAENILRDLTDDGIQVTLQYLGWNNGGLQNKKVTTNLSPVSVLGGKSGYNKLMKYLSGNQNVKAFLEADFITLRKSGNSFSALSDTVRTMFNTRTPNYEYMLSVYVPVQTVSPWYLLKPSKMVEAAEKFASSYHGTAGIYLKGTGEMLYSDFSKKGTSRAETTEYYKNTAALFKNGVSVNSGNSYSYSYADRIFSLPKTNDGNLIFSESVPFAEIVLHGFISYSSEDINRAEDTDEAFLRCVETGSDPYFCGMSLSGEQLLETSYNYLYSSSYSLWAEYAKSMYKSYQSVYQELFNKKITGHEKNGDLSKTFFEDGTVIYVNYGGTAITADGIEIPAKGYRVGGRAS